MTAPIGRLTALVLDCPDPQGLAVFYQSIVGGEIDPGDSGRWVELRANGSIVAFQQVDDHRSPTWPGGDVPQQAHLDIVVDDLDVGETALAELGVTKAGVQPKPADFRVFIDPAGHPFCLVVADYS